MSYPEKFVRGLSSEDCVVDGFVTRTAFSPINTAREDMHQELSINWFDDSGAIQEAYDKRKDNGEIQFKKGLAILNRIKMDRNFKPYKNLFCYERAPLDENKYHGNLLFDSKMKKPIKHIITSGLCLCVEKILPPQK